MSYQDIFKRREIRAPPRHRGVSQIKPFVAPALDGFLHRVVEVVDLLPDNKANATDDGGALLLL
jgi:hypothetical protein